MIGDVLFFRKTEGFISNTIAKLTNSGYTHVGLIVAFDELTKEVTIVESNRFIKTRLQRLYLEDEKHVIYSLGEIPSETRQKIVGNAMKNIGASYDYFQIVGLFLSLLFKRGRRDFFNNANKLICSEMVDKVYVQSGIKRAHQQDLGNITPQDLLHLYPLEMI